MLRTIEERNLLVLQYRFLPIKVYKTLKPQNPAVKYLGIDDALSEGHLALISAAEKWNPNVSGAASFKTYAYRCIQNRIVTFATSNYSPVHVPQINKKNREKIKSVIYAERLQLNRVTFPAIQEEVINPTPTFEELVKPLRPEEEEIITLVYKKGMTLKEVSNMKGWKSRQVTGNRITKILNKLREELTLTDG